MRPFAGSLLVVLALVSTLATALSRSAIAGDKDGKKIEVPVQLPVEPGSARAWVLLAGSVPTERSNGRHDLLASCELNDANVKTMRVFLEKKWGIKRRVDLLNTLDDLQQNGRRVALKTLMAKLGNMKLTQKEVDEYFPGEDNAMVRALFRHAPRLAKEKEGLLAWDLVECISLIRHGYAAGYVDETEAWRRLEVLGKRLQKGYESFQEIGEIWCIGIEAMNDPQAPGARAALEKLQTDEKSPWRTTAWDVKLAKLDAPPPPKPNAPESGGKRP